MPASRDVLLLDKLNSRSYTGSDLAGKLIITSYVLPAAMNTSLWTRGTPGNGLPSSAISENPDGGTVAGATAAPVCGPTIDGTCMRKPALTMRTKTVVGPEVGATAGFGCAPNSEAEALVLLNADPLMR